MLLFLYRMLSAALQPVLPALLRWRASRGKDDRNRFTERLGVAGLPRPGGHLVWVHAASVGDGQTLLPLIGRLGARGFNVLVTTRTLLSANALKRQLPAGAFHQFMPLDAPACVRRFLAYWQPDMIFLAGAELWPNVLAAAGRRDMPVIVVNGRVTDRVYGYCRFARGFVRSLLGRVELCLARGEGDAERFVELGAFSVQVVGDLALDGVLPQADPLVVSDFAARVGPRPIWVAALIDPGENATVLGAHSRLLSRFPDLLTVLIPRLPRDGSEVVKAAGTQNLTAALRSRDGTPARLPNLFVADIAGETGLFYRAAGLAFLRRSLAGGGSSPVDAAKLGCAILHGPRVEAFADLYAALDREQGGVCIDSADALAAELARLFEDGVRLRKLQRNAAQTVERLCGGTARAMRAIEPHVAQMLLDR